MISSTTKYQAEEPEEVSYTNSRPANYAAQQQEYSVPPQAQQQETYQQQQDAKSDRSDSPRELYNSLKESKSPNQNEEEKDMTASELKEEKEEVYLLFYSVLMVSISPVTRNLLKKT